MLAWAVETFWSFDAVLAEGGKLFLKNCFFLMLLPLLVLTAPALVGGLLPGLKFCVVFDILTIECLFSAYALPLHAVATVRDFAVTADCSMNSLIPQSSSYSVMN